MSRSRVERVERERLSGRRRVNVARVITPFPPPSVSLFLLRCPRGLSPCHSRSLTLLLYLSIYPSLLRYPPPCRNPSLARTRAALSRLRYYSLLSWSLFSRLSRPFISPRPVSPLNFHSVRATLLGRSELYPPIFFPPSFPLLCAHIYRCKPLSISRA